MYIPVVQRVAPKLPVRRESVRRAARHLRQRAVRVYLEQRRVGPEVGGIRRNVDRNVTDELHALCVGVGLQSGPLLVKQVLHHLPEADLPCQTRPCCGQRRGPACAYVFGPQRKGAHAVFRLQSHEQRVIVQPERVGGAEIAECVLPGIKAAHGQLQHGKARAEQGAVVDAFGRVRAEIKACDLVVRQQAALLQRVEVDEIGVGRKGRKALVRAVAVTRGPDGQDLPVPLPGRRQKIHKTVGFRPQAADAVGRGQRGDRHQDAAGAHQPFTAPATTPSMIYFWHARYRMMMGSTVSMMQAIMGPISTRP